MAAIRAQIRSRWALLLGLAVLAGPTGCYPPLNRRPGGYLVQTQCDVLRCQPQSNPPSFDIIVPKEFPSVGTYQKLDNVWKDKQKTYPLYVQPGNVHIVNVGSNEIPGCTLIMTSQGDWSLEGGSFLRLNLNEAVEAAYLAYDSRAEPRPEWLRDAGKYKSLTMSGGTMSLQVTTSMLDQSKTPAEFVKLDLYRITEAGPPGVMQIPANNEGRPGWGKVTKGSPAMYLVFVKPKATLDCSNGTDDNVYTFRRCYEASPSAENDAKALATVEAAALADCQLTHPDSVCANAGSTSHYLPWCTTDTGVQGYILTVPTVSFEQTSQVEFLPADSTAIGTVKGQPFATEASGQLYFSYQVDQTGTIQSMQVYALDLSLAAFDSDAGWIDRISVVLLQPCTAECTDAPAPVGTPCSDYVIPTEAFMGSASCTVDGNLMAFTTTNTSEIHVGMRADQHTFDVGVEGTLSTTIQIDDEDVPVEVSIRLVGEVLNYAPHAAAATDGDPFAECVDNTNETPIYLQAGQSFDLEDGTPSSANFDWYEDYGLVTQKHWGQGISATIGAHQLGFGVHTITLVVRDSFGVVARDTIEIDVHDTIPPTWNTVPGDVVYFPLSTEPHLLTEAELGTASAHDDCSAHVLVSNDAPADLRFPPGETPVTWTADDGRGQVATFVQRVIIIPLEDQRLLVGAALAGSVALSVAVDQCRDTLDTCGDAVYCGLDLRPLINSVGRLLELLESTPIPSGQEEWFAAAIPQLQTASDALQAAESLLTGDTGGAEAIGPSRATVRDHLTTAYEALQAIAGLPEPAGDSDAQPGRECAITTAAQGSPMEPDVLVLRRFRDEWLLTNPPGRCVVAVYDWVSPPLADLIATHETLRFLVRIMLVPVICGVKHPLVVVVLAAGIGLCWRYRRKRGRESFLSEWSSRLTGRPRRELIQRSRTRDKNSPAPANP